MKMAKRSGFLFIVFCKCISLFSIMTCSKKGGLATPRETEKDYDFAFFLAKCCS